MATKKNETALAVADNFQLMNRYEGIDPELLAELQDEMEDLDPESGITCLKIKIPSGGGLAYEVQTDEEDDAEYMKQIDAVVIFTHRTNGFWPGAYGSGEDQNQPPACASMDGKTAIWTDTGEVRSCEGCPYNEYGSGADQTGKQSRGKACKNMRRLYLMMSGDPNLYLLTVPPTSIKDVNRQLAKILAGGITATGMILRFTLERATNANGVAYSKVVIKKGGILPKAVADQATALRRQVKDQYKNVAITLDDYTPSNDTTAQARPARGGVDVGMSDEEWEALTGEKTGNAEAPQFQDAPPAGSDPVLPFD